MLAIVGAASLGPDLIRSAPTVKVGAPVAGEFDDLQLTMSALGQPRTVDDVIDGEAQRTLAGLQARGVVTGPHADRSRRVLSHPQVGELWVLPSTGGFTVLSASGAVGVKGALGASNPAVGFVTQNGEGSSTQAVGVVADMVDQIDVLAAGHRYRASILGNAYLWIAPDVSVRVTDVKLFARLHDGTVVAF